MGSQQQHPETRVHRKRPSCDGVRSCSLGHRCKEQHQQAGQSVERRYVNHHRQTEDHTHPHPGNNHRTPLQRREEKVLTQTEKLKRLPTHPARQCLHEPTKIRLKRGSFNHLAKQLVMTHQDILPSTHEEPLQEAEEWNVHLEAVLFVTEVQGVSSKREISQKTSSGLS